MKKFDPIDIFFIALIVSYFICLICLGITVIFLKIKNKDKKEIIKDKKEVKIKKLKRENNTHIKDRLKKLIIKIKSLLKKITNSKIIRNLFMKEVPIKKELVNIKNTTTAKKVNNNKTVSNKNSKSSISNNKKTNAKSNTNKKNENNNSKKKTNLKNNSNKKNSSKKAINNKKKKTIKK